MRWLGVYYIVFLVIGFIGGLVCPCDSVITGYANDYIGGGFIYSYRHDRDPMELLLFISVPIVIVAIIILIVKTMIDNAGYYKCDKAENSNVKTIEKEEKINYYSVCDDESNYHSVSDIESNYHNNSK